MRTFTEIAAAAPATAALPPAFKRACGKFCFHATRPPCVPARGAQRPARARRQGTRRQGSTWVGIRQTPPTPDGTSPRSRRPGQRWASCEQCASARPRWPRRTVTNRCVVRPLPLSVCFTVQAWFALKYRLPREQLPANGVVVAAAQAAGKYFGYNEHTVRIWRTDFEIDGECRFGRDSRGTWPRELLIHEENLKKKFNKWMRKAAKEETLSVDSALQYLNTDLLENAGAQLLKDYNMTLPVSRYTAWFWMRQCEGELPARVRSSAATSATGSRQTFTPTSSSASAATSWRAGARRAFRHCPSPRCVSLPARRARSGRPTAMAPQMNMQISRSMSRSARPIATL